MASAQHNFELCCTGLLDATAPLPTSFENALDPPDGGDTHTVHPFPMAHAPFVGGVDYASAQEDPPTFTPNDMYAISSLIGYSSFTARLDGTAPLPTTLDSKMGLSYGDDARTVYPFPVTDAPSAGAMDYHAQEDPFSFTPNDMYAVSSSLGYLSL